MAPDKSREQLHLAIPAQFRCPISLDLMRSPVSLSTGVTYDRSSIQRWLALGNNTCPATMQTLSSTRTTPNLTLRRLIDLWISQAGTVQSPSSPLSKRELAEIIGGELDSESLAKVIGFSTASEENLAFIARSEDAVAKLVSFFRRSDEIRIREQIVQLFDLISHEDGATERLNRLILTGDCVKDQLSSFAVVLKKGTTAAKIQSVRTLEQIAINPESKRKIAGTTAILTGIYALAATETDTTAIQAALSSLTAVSVTRAAKTELIRLEIVRTATRILSNSSIRGLTEAAIATVEIVATCTEGRAAIAADSECVAAIVSRLMKCSGAATEHGITVLWSVCCLARDAVAQEIARGANGLTKVLLVMQSDCSARTRQMCNELVKVLRVKGPGNQPNLASYVSRTTHITPY